MKSIIELSAVKAKEYLLKQESYINFDLPVYFSFQDLLNLLDKNFQVKNFLISEFQIQGIMMM